MAQANNTLRRLPQRWGAHLALAALTLQLVLSFGHFHPQDRYAQSLYGILASGPGAAGVWRLPANIEASVQRPSKLADDDDNCPICLSTFLLATSFVPDPPHAQVPIVFGPIDRLSARGLDVVAESFRAPFQSRAPPLG